MKHAAGTLQTPDGLTLHTEWWLPDAAPRAVVLVVHGLAEHIGRYAHVAAWLVERGYAVYGLDHRSHGKSGGRPRAYFERAEQPVSDLNQFFDRVKAEQPGKKIFLYAHSLGTLISYPFVLARQADLAGFVVSGTPLAVESSQPALLVRAGRVLNTLTPKLAMVALESKGLSHDPAIVTAYDSDPLVHRGNVRVRMGDSIVLGSRQARARLREFTLPLLIVHGGDDPICPAAGSQMLYDGAGAADKTLKIYPGLFHEIHNEPQKAAVLADIAAWLEARSGEQGA